LLYYKCEYVELLNNRSRRISIYCHKFKANSKALGTCEEKQRLLNLHEGGFMLDGVTGTKGVRWPGGFAEATLYLPEWRLWMHVVLGSFEVLPME
jgi:hypothetical protein